MTDEFDTSRIDLEFVTSGFGRPVTFDKDVALDTLRRMAEGETLKSACEETGLKPSTVRWWALVDNPPGFAALYRHAQELQMQAMSDEILGISDDATSDTYLDGDGKLRVDAEHIARSRLRVDTRKFLMGKIAPKMFGDKLALTGPTGGPVETTQLTEEQTIRRLTELGLPTSVFEE